MCSALLPPGDPTFSLFTFHAEFGQYYLPYFLGSPIEEKKRLLSYLTKVKANGVSCKSSNKNNDIPVFCFEKDAIGSTCTIIYIRYILSFCFCSFF